LFKEAKMNEESDEEADEPRRKSKGRDAVHAALVGAMVFAGSTLSNYGEVKAEHTPEHAKARSSMKAETDNTAVNKIDRMNNGITAEDQNNDSGNIQVLANIRKAITEDDSLSVNAHNVKVIVDNGKGPVDSRAEKDAIRSIANSQAPNFEVFDSITVEK